MILGITQIAYIAAYCSYNYTQTDTPQDELDKLN